MDPLPNIDAELCTGCGRCVELCPTDVLALRGGKAVLARPDQCTYCTICEDICPTQAIARPFLVVIRMT